MKIPLLEVNQSIGKFYLGVLPARTVIDIGEIRQRKFDPVTLNSFGGVQRVDAGKRIYEIAEYCSDPDATFPTPIILAIDSNKIISFNGKELEFDEKKRIGEVIDGQHRIRGIKESSCINLDEFCLPIVFMFDLTDYEKAYVFSIINSKQTKVSKSLIYDLFELSEDRSPYKTCHEIARLLNSDPTSPFYTRLKMLGTKETEKASLSQGTFVTYLLPLLSKNPDRDTIAIKKRIKLEDDYTVPLRIYFKEGKDEVIYRILFNLFNGVKEVFAEEWDDYAKFILSKSTGFGGILLAFKLLYEKGKKSNDLSKEYFTGQFRMVRKTLMKENKQLTSDYFTSGAAEEQNLANLIIKSIS